MHPDWFFSIQLDGSKQNLPSCTAATPLTTAIEPAHVAANNCKQKLQVAAWRFFNSIGRFQEKFAIVYCSHTTNYGHRTGPCCRQQLRAKAASSCMKGGGGHKACMRGALCPPPPSCSKGDEKRRACMKGLSQTSTTSRSHDSYVSATPWIERSQIGLTDFKLSHSHEQKLVLLFRKSKISLWKVSITNNDKHGWKAFLKLLRRLAHSTPTLALHPNQKGVKFVWLILNYLYGMQMDHPCII